jgi:hypothetical protein
MVNRRDRYRIELRAIDTVKWEPYLRERSGLPGPRANLELAQAVADEGDGSVFHGLIATGDEYLTLCGVVGLGQLWAGPAGGAGVAAELRVHATDGRWRVREAVAMALQRLGDADLRHLFDVATDWAGDAHPLVQRAAVAGVCEPRLLTEAWAASAAVDLCERVTRSLVDRPAEQRADSGVRALRQALGYCWSVAVAADPAHELRRFNALAGSPDPDVAWIVRENSRKARLARLL